MSTPLRLWHAAVTSAGLVLACSVPTWAAAAADDVRITFAGATGGSTITTVTNTGTVPTTQQIVRSHRGQVVARRSTATGNAAADFPDYDDSASAARAVVAVSNDGADDALTPAAGGFTFGADARLDADNAGAGRDNGNNVIQRGLFGDDAQYKLQVDANHLSCRIKGDLGAIESTSPRVLTPERWYRGRCTREVLDTGDRVVLTVTRIKSDSTLGGTTVTTSAVMPIGTLTFDAATPVSIGGKLNADLTLASSPDQFNGYLDNVVLDLP